MVKRRPSERSFDRFSTLFRKPPAYRLFTEIILNHIQAFYHGVKDFKSRALQNDLKKKIEAYQQRITSSSLSAKSETEQRQSLLATIAKNVKKSQEPPSQQKRKRQDDDDGLEENERKLNIKMIKVEEKPDPSSFLLIEPCNDTLLEDSMDLAQAPMPSPSPIQPNENQERTEPTTVSSDFIVLSSDEEDEPDRILPIYLLNYRSFGLQLF